LDADIITIFSEPVFQIHCLCLYTCAQVHIHTHTVVSVDPCACVHIYIWAYNFKSSFTLLAFSSYFLFASSFTNIACE